MGDLRGGHRSCQEAQALRGRSGTLLADAFSGNIRGLGPGVAEMEFTERTAEPIVAFMMDKTELGAFNLPISVDLFKDLAFDNARRKALDITDYLREHGPFEPHRLPMEDMEYTTLPHVMKNLASRFADTE